MSKEKKEVEDFGASDSSSALPVSADRECEKCDGIGERLIDWGWGERMYECMECDGTGVVSDSEDD
jgi:DnaJ-class molecular chaperone